MTTDPPEPGSTGRFLAAVHRLRADVERMVDELTEAVNTRIGALTGRVEALQEALAESQRGKESETPRTPDWPTLREEDPAEFERLFAEMTQWAARVLPRYPKVAGRMPRCWTQHADVIDVVTAAWTAWRAAYGPQSRPTDAINWHRDARGLIERQLDETFPGNREAIPGTAPDPSCAVHPTRSYRSP